MSIGTITFYNIDSVIATPIHFEHANPKQNIKSIEFVITDDTGKSYTVTVYGSFDGKNNIPKFSFAPTRTVSLP